MPTTIQLRNATKIFEASVRSARVTDAIDSSRPEPDQHPGLVYALNNVSLTVRPGEILGVLGPSGCGKSTLLRVCAGLDKPDSGEVLYDGVELHSIPSRERGIGMVFQSFALYPHLPSVDNIGFFLRLRKRDDEISERVREISQITGIDLGPLLDRKPPTLSGGEQQRVAIARCLARDPRVFFFDEPFSNLDAKLRTSARIELKRLLRRYAVTSVYVTHDQTEAIALCDRIAVMNKGEIVQVGMYEHLYNTPRNIFVAGFLGSPAMNLFPGRVQEGLWVGSKFNWGPIRSDFDEGRQIVLGVRPEHLQMTDSGGIAARVELVNHLYGERTNLIHAAIGASSVILKLPETDVVQPGQIISFAMDPAEVHLFDYETGDRVS